MTARTREPPEREVALFAHVIPWWWRSWVLTPVLPTGHQQFHGELMVPNRERPITVHRIQPDTQHQRQTDTMKAPLPNSPCSPPWRSPSPPARRTRTLSPRRRHP